MARLPKLQTVSPVRFYRIIDHSVVHLHKLRLPDKFVQKYGGEIVNVVRVKCPVGGQIWHIGVERDEKTLWLQKGWQKFMDYHSIDFGHFLIFSYKGNSKFDVNIFDITATEIEYALHEKTAEDDQLQGGNIKASPTNPSFKVTMKPYNVERSFILPMPTEFVRKNLPNKTVQVELQDSEGRKWPVRFLRGFSRTSFLSKGWAVFVRANKLVKGNVCVFELIQGNGVLLNVSIFPAKNEHAKLIRSVPNQTNYN